MRRLAVLLALTACAPGLSQTSLAGAVGAASAQPQTDDPAAPDGDLTRFGAQIVGAARIVGLGSPGPGARELPRLYHRFFRHLVERSGFTGLALDTDATATLALDRFVRGAALDLDAALQRLGDRGHATVELRGLLQWMRGHNAEHDNILRVFGLDPRDPEGAAAEVLIYLERVDPSYVPEARSLLAGGQQVGIDVVLARLDARRKDYLAAGADAWAEARQQAEVVAQARRMAETWEFEAGEFARARNAEWALAQLGEGGKLVVLADNRRVAAEVPGAAPAMGDFLRQWLASDYRAVAASFADGSVLVVRDPSHLCAAPLAPPRAGSLDAAVAALGLPIAVIDLRGAKDPALHKPQALRSLAGADAGDPRVRPAVAFDAIVGLQHVHPAEPIGGGPSPAGPCHAVPGK